MVGLKRLELIPPSAVRVRPDPAHTQLNDPQQTVTACLVAAQDGPIAPANAIP